MASHLDRAWEYSPSEEVFLGKTYVVSPYDSHPSMDLGVKWDLCVLFVQTGHY